MKCRLALILLISLALSTATAGELYKCKGADGEISFTNIQCPGASPSVKVGTFASAPDDPRQLRDAEDSMHQRAERDAEWQQSAPQRQAAYDARMRANEVNERQATRDKETKRLTNEAETALMRGHRVEAAQLSNLARINSGGVPNDSQLLSQPAKAAQISASANSGAIDQYGNFYAPAGPNGIVDTKNGQFLPKVAGGYIDPSTGQFIPAH